MLISSAHLLSGYVRAADYPVFANLSNTVTRADKLQAVDLDGDGDPDLVGWSQTDANGNGKVMWWENTGKGVFVKRGEWVPATDTSVLEIRDFNGDGKPDLWIGTRVEGDHPWRTAVCLSLGLSGFAEPGASVSDDFTQRIVDVNGDHLPDVVSQNASWLNQGDGTFKRSEGWLTPLREYWTYANGWSDADGDGLEDLIIFTSGEIRVLRNLGEAGFSAPETIYSLSVEEEYLRPDERHWAFFQDPQLGRCLMIQRGTMNGSQGVVELLASKDGVWKSIATLPLPRVKGSNVQGTLEAVRDGDRIRILTDDLHPGRMSGGKKVTADYSTVGEIGIKIDRSGVASLTWKDVLRYTGPSKTPVVADVNGDGRSDLILSITPDNPFPYPGDQIQWFAGLGSGSFTPKPNFVTGLAVAREVCYVGDLDGDGDDDIITDADWTGGAPVSAVCLWRNLGHGQSFSQELLYSKGTSARVLKVDAHDGKRAPEVILAARDESGKTPVTQVVSLTLGPRGSVSQRVSGRVTGGSIAADAEVADGDGDGIPDIRGVGVDANTWLKGIKGQGFRKPSAAEQKKFALAGQAYVDVDWDGDLDLWANDHWFENTGARPWASHTAPGGRTVSIGGTPILSWDLRPAGIDFDGDGHPDWISVSELYLIPLLAAGDGDRSNPAYPLNPLSGLSNGIYRNTHPSFQDLTGDGLPDVIYHSYAAGWQQTFFRENLGDGTFGQEKEIGVPAHGVLFNAVTYDRSQSLTGDINGDGIPDVITANGFGNLECALGVLSP